MNIKQIKLEPGTPDMARIRAIADPMIGRLLMASQPDCVAAITMIIVEVLMNCVAPEHIEIARDNIFKGVTMTLDVHKHGGMRQ